jgi:hypothetical protein
VTFYNHYLDVYDLHDKFEESTMLEVASLVLELENASYEQVFTRLIEYVNENRAAFRMIFSPNGTNKMRTRLGALLEGLLRQLYLEEKGTAAAVENADYMLFYRAQGIISIIQKWVQDDFKQPTGTVIKVMTALDGSTEERFETWIKDHK